LTEYVHTVMRDE